MSFHMAGYPKSKSPVLSFHFAAVLGGGGGGGGGGGRRPLFASEISPLTEVAAAAGDELSGPTSERGNDGRWTANGDGDAATCCKWVGFPPEFFPYWLRLLRFPSDLEIVSIFLVIYRIFCFIFWEFKNGSRVWIICQGNLCIFHASLIVV